MKIKYVVIHLDSSCKVVTEFERFEFNSVGDAIKKHMEVKQDYTDVLSWDLIVEYS